MGRPSKLDEQDRRERLFVALRDGHSLESASDLVDVTSRTVRSYRKKNPDFAAELDRILQDPDREVLSAAHPDPHVEGFEREPPPEPMPLPMDVVSPTQRADVSPTRRGVCRDRGQVVDDLGRDVQRVTSRSPPVDAEVVGSPRDLRHAPKNLDNERKRLFKTLWDQAENPEAKGQATALKLLWESFERADYERRVIEAKMAAVAKPVEAIEESTPAPMVFVDLPANGSEAPGDGPSREAG